MPEKVVVTGASGYIASQIIKDLLLKGYNVVGIVRNKNNTQKQEHLLSLEGAAERLTLEEGDNDTADYLTIFKGATFIVHTASPVYFTSENPLKDIVEPAIQGNIRVLDAAESISSLKKIVIISSAAAVLDSTTKKTVITEEDWNDSITIQAPYPYSKYLAEKKAHDWVKEYREKNKDRLNELFEVIFVNPAFVFGAQLSKNIGTTVQLVADALTGNPLNRSGGLTDVRDVADTITYILESKENFNLQRKLIVNDILTFKEIGERAAALFPHLQFVQQPPKTTANAQPPATRPPYKFQSISPIKLPREPTPIDETLKSTVEYLLANKYVTAIPK